MPTNMANSSELEQLRMPLRGLNAQSQINHARVERLRRELEAATEEMTKIDTRYREQLIHYARADCLQLANMMHERLPRELRELIYEYLCVEPDRPILVGPYYHFRNYDRRPHDDLPDDDENSAQHIDEFGHLEDSTKRDIEEIQFDDETIELPGGRIKTVHSHRPPSDMILPSNHILNPRYVGPAISREMQKMYYTRNTFSICNLERAIYNFLFRASGYSMQKCGPNRTPPSLDGDLILEPEIFPFHHVRKLQIRVKCEHLFDHLPKQAAAIEQYIYEQHFLRVTEETLEPLRKLVHSHSGHSLEIEFVIMTQFPANLLIGFGCEFNRRFINILQAIRGTVYTVAHDCLDSTVKITHYDEQVSIFPRDITGCFGLTKEQWEFEKSVSPNHESWVPGFYLAPIGVPYDSLISGFHESDLKQLLLERWGVDSVKDTTAKYPIKEGEYWPKGYVSKAYQMLR